MERNCCLFGLATRPRENESGVGSVNLLWSLMWWRPRCVGCGGRSPLFVDQMCFDCWHREMDARMWRELARAVANVLNATAVHLLTPRLPRSRRRRTLQGTTDQS